MKQLPDIDDPNQAGVPTGYPSFGLPDITGPLWKLRSAWLQNVTYVLMDMPQHYLDFGRQAYGLVKDWFFMLMWGCQVGPVPGRRGGFEQERLDRALLDPLPYIVMFSKSLLIIVPADDHAY